MQKFCSITDCDRVYDRKGFCSLHYNRWRKNGDPMTVKQIWKSDAEFCKVDGCELKFHAKGYCKTHYYRMTKYGTTDAPLKRPKKYKSEICNVVLRNGEPCKNRRSSLGMCASHYSKFYKYGSPYEDRSAKPNKDNYVVVYAPDHPNAQRSGFILEHRMVMSNHIGRKLEDNENVHHINGDRKDNRIENLEIWHVGQPAGQRVSDKVEWAVELLKQYAPERLRSENE